jgi:hypothetical protein
MGLLLVLGGAAALVMLSGAKAKASAVPKPQAAVPKPAAKKPLAHVDADDGEPVSLPPISESADQGEVTPPPRVSQPVEVPPLPNLGVVDVRPLVRDEPPTADELVQTVRETGGRWSVKNEDGSDVAPNQTLARARAQAMADHVRTKKTKYDRPRLAVWQALAGVEVDGLYGPATQAALQSMGARNVPRPLFKGGK